MLDLDSAQLRNLVNIGSGSMEICFGIWQDRFGIYHQRAGEFRNPDNGKLKTKKRYQINPSSNTTEI
jgi:hypothetical protein